MKMFSGVNVSKRAVSVALASGALLLASASVASAQEPSQALVGNSAGVVFGYDLDREVPLLGIDGRFTFPVAPQLALSINPGFNYFFTESSEYLGTSAESTVLQFDVNGLLHLALGSVVTPYLGAGLAMIYAEARFVNADGDVIASDDDTALAANALVGATFDTGSDFSPYVQGRLTFDEGSIFSLVVGLNYGF